MESATKPDVLATVAALRDWVRARRAADARIALVPTMGALHEGHIALVRRGFELADTVIATIFVNPRQFGPNEDFSAYPRTWDADLEKLRAAGVQAVYAPQADVMYPPDFATTVSVKGISTLLEGEFRPGYFDGIATVVTKLLLQALPDLAVFGEKDWQQLQVVRRLVQDLDIPVDIVGLPTVRNAEGLALSSRNAYLDTAQLQAAPRLNAVIRAMADRFAAGEDAATLERWGRDELAAAGFGDISFLEVRHATTIAPAVIGGPGPWRVFARAKLGRAWLIDNVPVRGETR